jgi:hypothetical protein
MRRKMPAERISVMIDQKIGFAKTALQVIVILGGSLVPHHHGWASPTQSGLKINSPLNDTIYPADFRSPTIRWKDENLTHKVWLVKVAFKNSKNNLEFFSESEFWTPSREEWDKIKEFSTEKFVDLRIYGLPVKDAPLKAFAKVRFMTSKDPVGAPIFFRAVPNPFPDPKDFVKIKWKLGRVSSYEPPLVVMEKQERCFNCHTSTPNGKFFGFEYNPFDDEGKSNRAGYLYFKNPGKVLNWDQKDFFDWNEFVSEAERKTHQAMLSAISPDGKYVVTGGKAKISVDLNPTDLIGYTLVTKGILLYYSLSDKTIRSLPGANDEKIIQAVPTAWSPDGKEIYFLRAAISPEFDKLNQQPSGIDQATRDRLNKLGWRDLDKLFGIQYDIYRIPFNDGKGGQAVPLIGAAQNGKSNYYPKISPDGKWIVFTQSASGFMLAREDSDLVIVPAHGGKARKLKSNGPHVDSWHSWSPNGHWLVFFVQIPPFSNGSRVDSY